MKRNILSDKLDELYKREDYKHPIQSRPEPDVSITGEKPDEDDLGSEYDPTLKDKDEVEKDLGKGSKKDLGLKGNDKDIGNRKKSNPKDWDFDGPRVSIKQES